MTIYLTIKDAGLYRFPIDFRSTKEIGEKALAPDEQDQAQAMLWKALHPKQTRQ